MEAAIMALITKVQAPEMSPCPKLGKCYVRNIQTKSCTHVQVSGLKSVPLKTSQQWQPLPLQNTNMQGILLACVHLNYTNL